MKKEVNMNRRLLLFERNVFRQIFRRSSTVKKQTPAEYCLELVRKSDHENFLCTLLLPGKTRAASFAIRAFNVEVAQVEDQVNDNKIGAMRLKFWTNALNDTYDSNPPRSPVTLELHRILQKFTLSKRYFKRLIDARLQKLTGTTFQTIEDIEKYAEYATSSVYYLLLEAHSVANVNCDHVASHMGKAHGIVNLIRSIPYNAGKRTNIIPQDILMKHNISTEAVLQGRQSKSLQDAVFEVASCAKAHLDKAVSLNSKVGKDVKIVFLPVVCLENYLEGLERVDFNVFHPSLQKRKSTLPLQLFWRKLRIR